ncbi:MBL fold metallo-hydrolase [Stutzerimonas degradans]|uniref:MBL fold metallo-hydrolase n=1 Tax=Stutzerimonas degradans TaxID=2968968 RepID=UPI00142434E8|nr:MBL fold metallo-hydrolase [Stutzerimonas degradans]NHW03481.1 MBL fold metallo-hydrolase [Stutzerimonas degradans]
MHYPIIRHHGARDGVTGSCHQLHMNAASSLLIDCGLFQGDDAGAAYTAGANRLTIEFSVATVKALVVTHVHIDHVGRTPYVPAAGFDGPILCSEPSAKLLPIVLDDAFKLGISRDQAQVERYLKRVEQHLVPLPYQHWFTLVESDELIARIRLQRAGHILGSAYVEIDLTYPESGDNKRVVFSGDFSAHHAPLLMPPVAPERADILMLESTYGDRLHEDGVSRRQRLEAVIERALQDQDTVLIHAFSIGRTQELRYELGEIIHSQSQAPADAAAAADARTQLNTSNWPELTITLDSPLAHRFTEAYRELQPYWNQEAREQVAAGRDPMVFYNLITIDSHADHVAVVNHLTQTAHSAIVIAGGGMCAGGRIVNYLKAMLGDARHNVLFVGYQAKGTSGQIIQQYGPKGGYVELDGERYDIRAGITSIGGYSAHADQQGLVDFVTGMKEWPTEIRVVHGEERAKAELAASLKKTYRQHHDEITILATHTGQ